MTNTTVVPPLKPRARRVAKDHAAPLAIQRRLAALAPSVTT
ncbi:hypothetical protein [Streptomyces olivaceus]